MILTIIFTLLIVGVILWAINTYVPMQPTIKNIMNVVVIILVLIWLFSMFTGHRLIP